MNARPIRAKQTRNQLGTPGGAKSFLRGSQILLCPIFFEAMSNTFFHGGEKSWGKVVTARPPTRLVQVRSLHLCPQRQVAKLASGLMYSWSLFRNNNTAMNLQMFASSYSGRRFAACDQGSQ